MFGIEFYMAEGVEDPDKDVFDAIVQTIKEAEGIPQGEYFIYLNDHYIDKRRGIGKKKIH